MRLRGAIAVVCSMAVGACGGYQGDDVGKAESQADLITDTCTTKEFDGNMCAGVWQYPDRCCAVGYNSYNSCLHSHKTGNYSFTQLVTFPTGPCYRECDTIPGRCIMICDPGSPDCGPTGQSALSNVNNVLSTCIKNPKVSWGAPAIVSLTYSLRTSTSAYCTAVVSNAPVSDSGVANSCGPNPDGLCDGVAGSEKLGACAGAQPAYPTGGVPAQGVATGIVNADKTKERQMNAQCPGLWVYSSPGKTVDRSEERRVGKECRSRWSPYH